VGGGRVSDGKNFQLSTICHKGFGTEILFFTYGFTTFIREKFIDSYSVGLRQIAAKLYRSTERNKAYQTIPSLLLPHPSRGRHTSLPPTVSRPSSVQNALRRLKFSFAGTGNGNQKLNLSSFREPLTARPRKSSKSTFVPGTNFLYQTEPRLVHLSPLQSKMGALASRSS
jgi:hypothetical protein